MKRSRPHLVTVAASAAVALVVGSVSAAFANHVFPDVSNSHNFHSQIGDMYDAGCYTGFPDGSFRPRDPANRAQFAFWLHNCSPRGDADADTIDITAADGPQLVGSVAMTNGAQNGSGVFVTVQTNVSTFSDTCDRCEISAQIVTDEVAPQALSRPTFLESVLTSAAGSFGEDDDAASVGTTFILDGPGPLPLAVEVAIDDPDATGGTVTVLMDLSVRSFVLDGAGNGAGPPPEFNAEITTEHGTVRLFEPILDGKGS